MLKKCHGCHNLQVNVCFVLKISPVILMPNKLHKAS